MIFKSQWICSWQLEKSKNLLPVGIQLMIILKNVAFLKNWSNAAAKFQKAMKSYVRLTLVGGILRFSVGSGMLSASGNLKIDPKSDQIEFALPLVVMADDLAKALTGLDDKKEIKFNIMPSYLVISQDRRQASIRLHDQFLAPEAQTKFTPESTATGLNGHGVAASIRRAILPTRKAIGDTSAMATLIRWDNAAYVVYYDAAVWCRSRVPFKLVGDVFEDGIAISETAAKTLHSFMDEQECLIEVGAYGLRLSTANTTCLVPCDARNTQAKRLLQIMTQSDINTPCTVDVQDFREAIDYAQKSHNENEIVKAIRIDVNEEGVAVEHHKITDQLPPHQLFSSSLPHEAFTGKFQVNINSQIALEATRYLKGSIDIGLDSNSGAFTIDQDGFSAIIGKIENE